MKEQLNEQLLGRYFAGEATGDELALILLWLEEDEQHQQVLMDYHRIWLASSVMDFRPDTDKAWQQVAAKTVKKQKINFLPWAAAVAGILTLGAWFVWFQQESTGEYISMTSDQATITEVLADGTQITLNSFSMLEFPEDFSGKERRVKLIGEAFFEVARDESKPFIIEANGTEIKVLGTSFTINARDENVKVSVNSGLVEFISPQKQRVKLEKDQEAVYEAEKDTIRAAPITDRNVFAFKTKVFEFNETELSEVVTALNKAYQINIRLGAGDWKNYHLSTRFENEKLEDVLVIVAETFDLSLSHSDSTFTFSKKMNLQ